MKKNLKKNSIFIIFYISLFIVIFSSQFFVSKIDNKLKFGKKGSNFFFKKYKKNPELHSYLDEVYLNFNNLSTRELCYKLVYESYEIKKPIKKILFERNIKDCNPEFK